MSINYKLLSENKKILMFNPPLIIHRNFIDNPAFSSFGMLYGIPIFEELGFKVEFIDSFLIDDEIILNNDFLFIGCNYKKILSIINQEYSDYLFINFTVFQKSDFLLREEVLSFINKINRKNHKVIILADFYMSDTIYYNYNKSLLLKKNNIDHIFKGNIKNNIVDFISIISNINKKEIFKDHKINSLLNRLNFNIDFEKIDLNKYLTFFKKASRYKLIKEYDGKEDIFPLFTSIGCNYRCAFCNKFEKIKYNSLNLSHIFNHLLKLKNYNVKKIFILDPIANYNKKIFHSFIDKINNLNLKIYFVNGLRIDLLDEELIKKLTICCDLLPISIESGAQSFSNKNINKKMDLKLVKENIKLLYKYRIPVYSHYIIGFQKEKIHEINKTLDFAWELFTKYDVIPRIQFFVPINKKNLFNKVNLKNKININNFNSSALNYLSYRISKDKLSHIKDNFLKKMYSDKSDKIIINLTYKCNNNCLICAIGDRKHEHSDFNYIKEYIKNEAEKGIYNIDLDGGEPTLYPYLFEILDLIVSLKFKTINLTTNGRMLSYEGFAKKLSKYPISILISLYSMNQKTHDTITNSENSFNQTIIGIKNTIKYFKKVGINTTITKYNYKDVDEIAEFIRNNKISVFNIQYLSPFGNTNREHFVDLKKASKLIKKVNHKYNQYFKINLINFPHCYLIGYEDYLIKDYFKINRKMLFVNKEEVNLSDYLSKKRYKNKKCKKCLNNSICMGHWEK